MNILHNIIQHTYLNVFKLFGIEIETDIGWCKINSVNITNENELIQIETINYKLMCSPKHILIKSNGDEILACNSLNSIVKTKFGNLKIVKIIKLNIKEHLYDITLEKNSKHTYYTNNILSHNCVIMDEAGFVPNNIASKVFESIYPVISSSKNSQFIMVSTPNGADPRNLYYEIWCKANSKNSEKNVEGWKAFRFDWWDVPGRDLKWKANTIASIGEQRFAQEFGNEFLTTSTVKKLIPSDIIEKYRVKLSELRALDKELTIGKKQNIFSEKGDKLYEFTMWHEFKSDHTYLASGDVAEGIGGDSSILYVWDVTDLRNITQCAMFSSNQVSPVEFAFITNRILAVYNNPYYICERNGIGSGYLDSLSITYKYANIVNEGKNGELGVFSHVTTKEKACIWAREMMTTLGFGWTIYDRELLNELDVFAKKDTSSTRNIYAAIPPAHDDHVLAWIWCTWILLPELVEKYYICVQTFTSLLEKVYPLILQPYKEYTTDQLAVLSKDPFYREFIAFKDEMMNKLGKAVYQEQVEQSKDAFDLQIERNQRYEEDPYFLDDSGPSWNDTFDNSNSANPMNKVPTFYMC